MSHPSGEIGCRGYLPTTWENYSKEILGYTPERTKTNERYVTLKKIQEFLEKGYTSKEIFLVWNQGRSGQCVAGVNGHGVNYNSCQYANRADQKLKSITD